MEIYLASIEGVSGPGNTRVQVRVLPHMKLIDRDSLPIWPYFFKHQAITGKLGENVWCISNPDFSMGYVLGLANDYTITGKYEENSLSVDLFKLFEDNYFKANAHLYNKSDLIVSFYNKDAIHFTKRESGETIIAYSNGSYIQASADIHSFNVGTSYIKIEQGKISIVADKILLSSNDVCIGNNPQGNLLISPTSDSASAIISKSVRA